MIRQSFVSAIVPSLFAGIFALVLCSCQSQQKAPLSNYIQITKPSFVKVWDVQLSMRPGDTIRGIYLVGDQVHVLTNANFDNAVKADSGAPLYQNQITGPDNVLQGGPTQVKDGIVFPTSHTLELYSPEGSLIRSVDTIYHITNQAVGNGSFVYVGLDFKSGCLGQFDVTQDVHPMQWSFLTFGAVDGPVAIADGVIYCGSEDGAVRSCLEDRTAYWPLLTDSTFTTGSKIVSGVAVDNRACYFSTISGQVYCLDKQNGKVLWQYLAGTPLEYGPQVTDTTVYQYVPGLGLCAIDKTDSMTLDGGEKADESPFHTPRWSLKRAGRILGEDDQNVYVVLGGPDQTRGLAAVDKKTGQIAFVSTRKDLIFLTSDPKAAMIYGVTRAGHVVAIQPVLQPGSYGEIAMLNDKP